GLLSGTPTASGSYSFTVIATDSNGATGREPYTLTINPAITISPTTLPAATVGVSYSTQLTASGGSGHGYTFSAAGLPSWLKLSAHGLLSGKRPSTSGSPFTFTVTVTDSNGASGSASYTLNSSATPTATNNLLGTPITSGSSSASTVPVASLSSVSATVGD